MNPETLTVDFENVQAHYDLSDDFFKLYLDPTMTYSCAYFPTGKETLEEAQIAKLDLTLGKLKLKSGERLLDIGCGWGSTARRAREKYGVKVVGLTLSKNQFEHASRLARGQDGLEFRLEGWETYNQPCDKIVSIGAFEHFTPPKYDAFFARCKEILPENGLMLLHTITTGKPNKTFTFLRWTHFIITNIFPGGRLPDPEQVVSHSRLGGFELLHAESLRLHYAHTLDLWAANLERNRGEAIRVTTEETYKTYIKYLTSCADHFRSAEINVYQFLLKAI
ncbi:MAG: class I SAM-dependent methyltransferase [Bacteroidota bacterium]